MLSVFVQQVAQTLQRNCSLVGFKYFKNSDYRNITCWLVTVDAVEEGDTRQACDPVRGFFRKQSNLKREGINNTKIFFLITIL
jgi:hypothetical protein